MNWPVADFQAVPAGPPAPISVRRSAPPSQPPQGRATDNPLHAIDPTGLRALVGLVFDQREAAELLRITRGCTDGMLLRPGALIAELCGYAQAEPHAGQLLDRALACRLWHTAAPFADMPVCTLALLWAGRRGDLDGHTIAALLWVTLRAAAPCRRHFAQRLLDDIGWLGARAIGAR